MKQQLFLWNPSPLNFQFEPGLQDWYNCAFNSKEKHTSMDSTAIRIGKKKQTALKKKNTQTIYTVVQSGLELTM